MALWGLARLGYQAARSPGSSSTGASSASEAGGTRPCARPASSYGDEALGVPSSGEGRRRMLFAAGSTRSQQSGAIHAQQQQQQQTRHTAAEEWVLERLAAGAGCVHHTQGAADPFPIGAGSLAQLTSAFLSPGNLAASTPPALCAGTLAIGHMGLQPGDQDAVARLAGAWQRVSS